MSDDQKKGYNYMAEGKGRDFDMPERGPIEKNDAERQTPKLIDLESLNGEGVYSKGMPKNFSKQPGRTLEKGDEAGAKDID